MWISPVMSLLVIEHWNFTCTDTDEHTVYKLYKKNVHTLRAHDGPLICLEKEAGNDSMCYARQAAPSVGIRINRDSASRRFRSNKMQKYSFDDMTKKKPTTNPREINKMSPTVFTCRRVTSQTGPADSRVWPNEDAVRLADSARQ